MDIINSNKEIAKKINDLIKSDKRTKTLKEFIKLFEKYKFSNEDLNRLYNDYKYDREEYKQSFVDFLLKEDDPDEDIAIRNSIMLKYIDKLAIEKNLIEFKDFYNRIKNKISEKPVYQEFIYENYEDCIFGGKTLKEWFEEYINEYNLKHPPEEKENVYKYEPIEVEKLNYPFKSKIRRYENDNIINVKTEPIIPDFKLKSLKPLYRPTYSPEPYCWEIDIMFVNHPYKDSELRIYLFCINVNTRYLIVIPIKKKSSDEVKFALNILIHEQKVKSIKGDGERGFNSKLLNEFYKQHNIKTYFSKSPYTYHNKIVDSVIRTIRNAFGLDAYKIADTNLMRQMVDYYNNTYHNTIKMTPKQMNDDVDLEWRYIRRMDNLLKEVLKLQKSKGLLYYKKGNIIMVHLDYSKTSNKFDKQRRNFNDLAEFIKYKNRNVLCKLLKNNKIEEIPNIYTKFVAFNIQELSDDYKNFFLIR